LDSQKAYVELHHLRYLRAVVRTGSVTAEAEFVAQPSVSKQLRALELGVPLFHRVGRRVVPTGAALALADCAVRVFDEIATTIAAVSGPESPLGESLRMCATETVSDNLLPRALAELGRRHSRCHILVEMLGTDDAIERVLADEFDLAIVVLPLADSRLDIHSLLTEEVLLTVGPGHRWASFASIALREVPRSRTVASMPGLGLRRWSTRRRATRLELDNVQPVPAGYPVLGPAADRALAAYERGRPGRRYRAWIVPAEPATGIARTAPSRIAGRSQPSRRALAAAAPLITTPLGPYISPDEVVDVAVGVL
jgi:DNA-binding transcriptional LysR family regulator